MLQVIFVEAASRRVLAACADAAGRTEASQLRLPRVRRASAELVRRDGHTGYGRGVHRRAFDDVVSTTMDRIRSIGAICHRPLSAGLRGILHFHFVIEKQAKIRRVDAHDDEYRRDDRRFDHGRARVPSSPNMSLRKASHSAVLFQSEFGVDIVV